mmetsp:Transcript_12105/g.17380  ORF Transcript_12105/g.17380 Transcript_12105/m.17380 type:complete len:214 (-) Transcript_12105:297-938(-)
MVTVGWFFFFFDLVALAAMRAAEGTDDGGKLVICFLMTEGGRATVPVVRCGIVTRVADGGRVVAKGTTVVVFGAVGLVPVVCDWIGGAVVTAVTRRGAGILVLTACDPSWATVGRTGLVIGFVTGLGATIGSGVGVAIGGVVVVFVVAVAVAVVVFVFVVIVADGGRDWFGGRGVSDFAAVRVDRTSCFWIVGWAVTTETVGLCCDRRGVVLA